MVRRVNAYEAILKLRAAVRDSLAVDVARAAVETTRRTQLHAAADAESAEETIACRDAVESGDVDRAAVLQFSDYQVAQRATIARTQADLADAAAALATCRAALGRADVAVRVVQSLRDRKLLAEQAARSKRERIELEDRTGNLRCA